VLFMDDVIHNKCATIARCLKRIEEEFIGFEDELDTNFTKQDSIILNLQRACEASIDVAMHVVRIHKLGLPQQSRDAFKMMKDASMLDAQLAERMQAMVGFRNIAVHDYRQMSLDVVRFVIHKRLDDFRDFSQVVLAEGGK